MGARLVEINAPDDRRAPLAAAAAARAAEPDVS
jgi:hypothetical protein